MWGNLPGRFFFPLRKENIKLENLGIYALGFLGQGLFGARLIIQIVRSEKEHRVVSPSLFWWFSLAASFVFLIYGVLRKDPVIIGGQTLSYYIYVRNLQLKHVWQKVPAILRLALLLLPVAPLLSFYLISGSFSSFGYSLEIFSSPIMIMGSIGQLALNLRFVYQWYYSERSHESLLPVGFWYISTWASVLVIIYSVFHPLYGIDPVLLVSQGFGIVIYVRNIFIYKSQSKK
jgi:lipid-A-disaccharide synthase-like uncharacterized protein